MRERSTFPLAGNASPFLAHAAGMGRMMLSAVAALAAGAALARTIVVPPPAMPEHADTEVSTKWFSCDVSSHFFCIMLR